MPLAATAALILATVVPLVPPASAQVPARLREVILDREGVIRWRDDGSEVALFGANYVLPSASDYRAAGYLQALIGHARAIRG